ncbi:MAG: hypothetical protein GAK28_03197 [Luteibacter sp.]|uniref:MASE1 domain-containing protein n=1 Tax=Luteibacter sp. TaxID=1886636 RepID=UPI001384B0B5|nr:MASE1 domain-containing protein [Luteibacter sp.]KAF1005445.1 MAG: hypothetical protein GAK28_03197 [Luteibacter sp.]
MLQGVKGLFSAVVYAIALYFLRDLSSAHWYLPAGLRFAALLVMPTRYWPWLYAGECASLLAIRASLIELRGIAWVTVSTVTAFPPIAAIVHAVRRRSAVPSITGGRDVLALLLAAGLVSLVSTTLNILITYSLMLGKPTNPVPYVFGIWLLGQYLGILMFSSTALLWANRSAKFRHPPPLWREGFVSALFLIALLAIYRSVPSYLEEDTVHGIRVALAIAAFALTYRHGWRGAAIGALALTLGVGLTSGPDYDQSTLHAQQVVAFIASSLLAAGAVMTHNYEIAMEETASRAKAEAAGRMAWHDSEEQNLEHMWRAEEAYSQIMRQTEGIIGSMRQAKRAEDLMRLTGDLLASTRSATVSVMHEIYPTIVFSADGLFGALRARKISPNIRYRAALFGDTHAISKATSINAYRVAGSAIDFVAGLGPRSVTLTVRIHSTQEKRRIYLRAVGDVTTVRSNAGTAAIARLRRRVTALGGIMNNDTGCIAVLLPDNGLTDNRDARLVQDGRTEPSPPPIDYV